MTANDLAYLQRLKKPDGPVDVVMDTDTYNEIDDQYALAYLLLSGERLQVKGIFAAPFYSPPSMGRVRQNKSAGQGMEQSYDAILEQLAVMDRLDLHNSVFHGSPEKLPDEETPVESEAARELIRLAKEHTPDHPLYVVCTAVLTDIASALLLAPEITDRVTVVWLGGNGKEWQTCNDFNAIQDIAAARVVFGCGAAVVQLPCNGVVSEFRISRVELEYFLKGKNRLCDYLLDMTLEYMQKREKSENWTKPLWDVTAVAWLLDASFMEERYEPSPVFEYDGHISVDPGRQFIRYVYHINRDLLFEDLFAKLTAGTVQAGNL